MSERVYEVVEKSVTTSIGYVRATSRVAAVEKVRLGQVQFLHGDAEPLGVIRARWLRGEEARYCDPGLEGDNDS